MIFGNSSLVLKHLASGTKIHFNAYDALIGWKKEALPPVEVPAAAKWKFRRLVESSIMGSRTPSIVLRLIYNMLGVAIIAHLI